MARVFTAAFLGRIAAYLFVAICAALGFGPPEWAAMILGTDPSLLARAGFLILAALTFAVVAGPHLVGLRRQTIPLKEAAQIAYETAERAGLIGVAYGLDQTPAERLLHSMDTLLVQNIRFYGQKPPSTRKVRIPKSELENLHPRAGSNELTDIIGRKVEYEDVSLSRLDFWWYRIAMRVNAIIGRWRR